MPPTPSTVISMRLPAASTDRLRRMANRHGWTPSDASARLVEEGLRRSEWTGPKRGTIFSVFLPDLAPPAPALSQRAGH